MTIRSKLQFSTFTHILLVVAVGIILIITFRQIGATNQQSVAIAKINDEISELRFLTVENLLHHEKRSYQQWQSKHHDISIALASIPSMDPERELIRADMQKQQFEIKVTFDRLALTYGEQLDARQASTELHDRLASQLLVRQQTQIAGASKLVELNREETSDLLVRSNWLIFLTILTMLLATVINSSAVTSVITRSFDALRRGANEIAQGRLSYRVKLDQNDDEFGQLAGSFNSMADSLEQVDKMKSEFVMLTSHQLRTPATAVKGFISLLLGGYWGKLNEAQAKRLRAADAENDAQLRTIDQILEVAKLEAGKVEYTKSPTDVGKLIAEVLERQQPYTKAAGQTVAVDQPEHPVVLLADRDLLAMALDSLVNNASKYSPKGSHIDVVLRSNDTSVTIQVKDAGYGIALADQKQLFKRFSQIKSSKANLVGGSGLGLYIAKSVAQLHGGTITVNSSENQGSTFTIELPITT